MPKPVPKPGPEVFGNRCVGNPWPDGPCPFCGQPHGSLCKGMIEERTAEAFCHYFGVILLGILGAIGVTIWAKS